MKTGQYSINPTIDIIISPILVWVCFLFIIVLTRIIVVFFIGYEGSPSELGIDADIVILIFVSIWHAWVWRAKAFIKASLLAAIEWPILTASASYLLLRFVWLENHQEVLLRLKFWEGGLFGLLVVCTAIAPLIFGPLFGLASTLKSERSTAKK